MKIKMEKWLGHRFESSCSETEDFKKFASNLRANLKSELSPEYSIVWFSRGHFYCSACVRHESSQKLMYISIPDVRYWQDEWFSKVLYRTMENEKDYTGGRNNYCNLRELKKSGLGLLAHIENVA